MKVSYAALAGALVLVAAGAHAETAPVPASAPAASEVSALVAAPGQAVLRTGTPVALRMSETLTTEGKRLRAGQRFRLETAAPITVDGQEIVPAGSPAFGEVTEVRNKGMWGKSGRINGRLLYVVANGRQIRMSGDLYDKGSKGTAGVVAAIAMSPIIVAPIAGFFITGTSARIDAGGAVSGFIDEDVPLDFAANSPKLMPVAPAAPVATLVAVAPAPEPAPAAPVAVAAVVAPVAVAPTPAVAYAAPAPITPVGAQPVPYRPAPMPAVTRVASFAPVPVPAVGMSETALKWAQRDEYSRLVSTFGYTPARAMAEVEKKYGFAMQ